ncbi:MAG: hypothetical protein QRY74_02540 [Chlamydia sp.]
MRPLLLAFIFCLQLLTTSRLFSSEEELIIDLSHPVVLYPTFLIPPSTPEESEISQEHFFECIKVLSADIEKNGMMSLIETDKAKIAEKACQANLPKVPLHLLEELSIRYVIECNIDKSLLSIQLTSLPDRECRSYSPISLTGRMSSDRGRIHQLADFIFEDLFHKKGIATTRILYSKRFTKRTAKSTSQKMQQVSTVAEIYLSDYDGANERQLTTLQTVSVTPQWIPRNGPEGAGFLFVSYIIGQPKIYIASFKNQKIIRLSPMRGNQLTPAVSFDGKKVAFCSDILGSSDLYMLSFDPLLGELSKPRQIYKTPFCTTGCPSFSPDGRSIAFVSNKDGSPKIYTITIPPESSKLQDIKPALITKKWRENSPPAWSPDGKKIAYSAKSGPKDRQIWVYDFEQDREYPVTAGFGNKENPSWAPNSLHLTYQGMDTKGKWDIYIIDLNRKKPVKITGGSGDNQFPSWEVRY